MKKVKVFVRHDQTFWYVMLTPAQARRLDNGAMISCGLTVPEDLTEHQLMRLNPVQVSRETWAHSGCQSSCVLRGAARCSW